MANQVVKFETPTYRIIINFANNAEPFISHSIRHPLSEEDAQDVTFLTMEEKSLMVAEGNIPDTSLIMTWTGHAAYVIDGFITARFTDYNDFERTSTGGQSRNIHSSGVPFSFLETEMVITTGPYTITACFLPKTTTKHIFKPIRLQPMEAVIVDIPEGFNSVILVVLNGNGISVNDTNVLDAYSQQEVAPGALSIRAGEQLVDIMILMEA